MKAAKTLTDDRLQRELKAVKEMRQRRDTLWRFCRWMDAHRHWWYRVANEKNMRPVPIRRRGFKQYTEDLIGPAHEAIKARMLQGFVTPFAVTTRGHFEEDLQNAARYATALFGRWADDTNQDDIKEQIVDSLIVTGNAFQRIGWDPTSEKNMLSVWEEPPLIDVEVTNTVTRCNTCGMITPGEVPQCPACGSVDVMPTAETSTQQRPQGQGRYVDMPVGNITMPFLSPDAVYPPPAATSLDNATYLWIRRYESTQWVKNHFGVEVSPEKLNVVDMPDWEFNNIIGLPPGMTPDIESHEDHYAEDMVTVWEYMRKPSKDNPDGKHCFYAGETATQVLNEGKYPDTQIPFRMVHYRYRRMNQQFWGSGMLERVIGPQKRHNKLLSMSEYIMDTFGHPHWKAVQGSGVTEEMVSGFSGFIEYPMGQEPKLEVAPMPSVGFEALLDKSRMAFNRVSEVPEGMLGGQEGSVRANNAITSLIEQANLPIIRKIRAMLYENAKLHQEGLRIWQDRAPDKVRVEVTTAMNEVVAFNAVDVKKPGLQVRPDYERAYPQTMAGKQRFILEMYHNSGGRFPDMMNPRTRQLIERLGGMELGELGEDFSYDQQAALQEFQRLKRGEPITPPDPVSENMMVHIDQHRRDLNRDEWRQLRYSPNPQEQQLYQQAWQHLQATQTVVQQMQMQQAQAQGPAGPKPQSQPASQGRRNA